MASNNPGTTATADEFTVVGTRPDRHDGIDKVTGFARYSADTNIAGTLWGRVLRSPHAHARIRSIDTSKAEALNGVKSVVTAADLPSTASDEMVDLGEGPARVKFMRDNILATDKVLYRGHAVAGVAASVEGRAEFFQGGRFRRNALLLCLACAGDGGVFRN